MDKTNDLYDVNSPSYSLTSDIHTAVTNINTETVLPVTIPSANSDTISNRGRRQCPWSDFLITSLGIITIIGCIGFKSYVSSRDQIWLNDHEIITTLSKAVGGLIAAFPLMIVLVFIGKPEDWGRGCYAMGKVFNHFGFSVDNMLVFHVILPRAPKDRSEG